MKNKYFSFFILFNFIYFNLSTFICFDTDYTLFILFLKQKKKG